MAHWVVVVAVERYEAERLFGHDTLELTLDGPGPSNGDDVVLVAAAAEAAAPGAVAAEAVVFGLGRVDSSEAPEPHEAAQAPEPHEAALHIAYTRRLFDEPVPADDLAGHGPGAHAIGAHAISAEAFAAFAARVGAIPAVAAAPRREWMVSLDLPIEASTPAEAVRAFWGYAMRLGPRELPTFVSPAGDELAMQAYVLGEPTNLDPEEDD